MTQDPTDGTDENERASVGASILAGVPHQELRTTDFQNRQCAFIHEAEIQMASAGIPIDSLTIANFVASIGAVPPGIRRHGLSTFINDLAASAPVPASGSWYAAAVIEASVRREVKGGAERLAQAADAGSLADLRTILDTVAATARTALARTGVPARA